MGLHLGHGGDGHVLQVHHQGIGEELGGPVGIFEAGIVAPDGAGAGDAAPHGLVSIAQPLAEIAPTIFYDFNLRYIVLDYWQMPDPAERARNEHWVAAALPDISPVYDDGRLKVYQSPPMTAPLPYLTLGNGWSAREKDDSGHWARSFIAGGDSPPELFLHHPQRRAIALEITATSEIPQRLTVLAGDRAVGKFLVSTGAGPQTIYLPAWLADPSVKLTFIAPHPAGSVQVSRVGLTIQACPEACADF